MTLCSVLFPLLYVKHQDMEWSLLILICCRAVQDAIVLAQKAELQSLTDELQTVQTEVKTSHTRIADLTLKTQGQ